MNNQHKLGQWVQIKESDTNKMRTTNKQETKNGLPSAVQMDTVCLSSQAPFCSFQLGV
jgi:hypothetical protein